MHILAGAQIVLGHIILCASHGNSPDLGLNVYQATRTPFCHFSLVTHYTLVRNRCGLVSRDDHQQVPQFSIIDSVFEFREILCVW